MKCFAAAVFFFILALPVLTAQAGNYVGIILSGYEENCEVTHNGKAYECDERRELFIGDVVKKKPSVKALKIKWAPYVKGEARGQVFLEVVPVRADKMKGDTYAGMAKQYAKDFVKPADYSTTSAVTRDPAAGSLFPVRASLMRGVAMKLPGGDGAPRSVIVTDPAGKAVYQKQFSGAGDRAFTPDEMGMKPGETYSARFSGGSAERECALFLLDDGTKTEVLKGLDHIDREKLSNIDKALRKAVYLQLVTDAYPEKMDLYWLSDQVLRDKNLQFRGEQEETVSALRRRYVEHFRKSE